MLGVRSDTHIQRLPPSRPGAKDEDSKNSAKHIGRDVMAGVPPAVDAPGAEHHVAQILVGFPDNSGKEQTCRYRDDGLFPSTNLDGPPFTKEANRFIGRGGKRGATPKMDDFV